MIMEQDPGFEALLEHLARYRGIDFSIFQRVATLGFHDGLSERPDRGQSDMDPDRRTQRNQQPRVVPVCRGRAFRYRITCTPFLGSGGGRAGAVLVMEGAAR
jgi:hypothetical protein